MKIFKQVLLIFCLSSSVSIAEEVRVEMQGMSVVGNKESPNLLYIVPWKEAKKVDDNALNKFPKLFDETVNEEFEKEIR